MHLPPALDREGVSLVDKSSALAGPDGGELPGAFSSRLLLPRYPSGLRAVSFHRSCPTLAGRAWVDEWPGGVGNRFRTYYKVNRRIWTSDLTR